ncbi:MAG TPA: Lrp/AsnC family transcriptional regulator [Mesorhizobium sp.]|jgi:DNA-binding Lrp family transcriptional regulator|nr:Lrp/AsnC family transcriptional regulator [Mesorhizobium sp.]
MNTNENTNRVRRRGALSPAVDAVDRKLLGLLAEDATLSYAELGRRMNLSAPAVHERAKRLKEIGAIQRTVAVLDPELVGKPLLALVHVDTAGWGKTPAMMRLAELPEVEEIHAVTGDACLILKVRTAGPAALEDLLAHIYAVPGVRGTRSYVVLRTHLERGVSAAVGLDGSHAYADPTPLAEAG